MDDNLDIVDMLKTLWLKRNLIIKITLIFFVFGLIYSVNLPNKFKASSIFYPHYEEIDNSNSLRSLAGIAGINLEPETSKNIPSNLYPKLISSPIFKNKILDEIIISDDTKIKYRDYIMNNYSFVSITDILSLPFNFIFNNDSIKKIENYKLDILKFSNDEYKIHKFLSEAILINLNEQEGFIELSVKDKDPYIASQIADIAKNNLQKSIIKFKIKNINETYKFINNQLKIAKENFYNLQDSLAIFRDNNKNIKSDVFMNQYSRIQSEVRILENIYNELALNNEKILIDVRKNTPIFTVIKPVVIPNEKDSPGRLNIVIFITFLGVAFSTTWLLTKSIINELISKIID